MSVLINMEMPKSCYGNCPFFTQIPPGEDHGLINYCCLENWKQSRTPMPFSVEEAKHGRQDFCPLVPVPPHGRLIDADQMANDETVAYISAQGKLGHDVITHQVNMIVHSKIQKLIEDTPTVIPADWEEGEG